jgi:hypothetical protein
MSQEDYTIANAPGASVRADLNNQLQAIVTWNSGDGAPDPSFPHMPWPDTAEGLMKQRNSANTEWITIGKLGFPHWDIKEFLSGTKMLFYQDTAPDGWSLLDTLNNKYVYITKGSIAGGETGGTIHSTGSYTISGLTHAHTHTGPSHTHSTPNHSHSLNSSPVGGLGGVANERIVESGGYYDRAAMVGSDTRNALISSTTSSGGGTTGAGGNGATSGASTDGIVSDGTWRLPGYCCIICEKD